MTQKIRVLITDDQAIVRKGIQALLATEPNIEVAGEAENGKDAIKQVEKLQPDVILMDLQMPEMDGIEAIGHITASRPNARILVLTSFATDDKVFPAIKAGAWDLLTTSSQRVDPAINRSPGVSLAPPPCRKVLQELSRPPATANPNSEPLTSEKLTCCGCRTRSGQSQIADQLIISEATVRTHVSNI